MNKDRAKFHPANLVQSMCKPIGEGRSYDAYMDTWDHIDVYFNGKRYFFLGRPDQDNGRDHFLSLPPEKVCFNEHDEVWIKMFHHGWYAVKKSDGHWETRWSL